MVEEMDIVNLIGNKIFTSLYDPKADTLFAEFRKKAEDSMNSLKDIVSKADSTKAIITKIPGVSDATKAQLDKLIQESKSFTSSSAASLSPSTIIAKKAEVSAKINTLVQTAQEEGAANKAKIDKKTLANAKENTGEVSLSKSLNKIYKIAKIVLFWLMIVILGLFGGSLASNAAINLPPYMRLYYFIYGTILFPVSYGFAIKNYMEGKPLKFHASLAPLVEGTTSGLFSYKSLFVQPLPVEVVAAATAVPEAAVQAVIAANASTAALAPAVLAPAALAPAVLAPATTATALMNTISQNAKA